MAVERPGTHLRLSYHYDSENKGGIVVNSTFRNMVLNSSRLIMEADLSSYPKLLLDYFKYAGKKQNFAVGLSGIFINSDLPLYDSLGVSNNIFGSNYSEGAIKIQSTALRNSTFGFKLDWSLTKLNAKVTEESIRDISKISYNNTKFTFFYNFNNLNDRYFPTRGLLTNIELSSTVNTNGKVRIFDIDYDLEDLGGDLLETDAIHALKAEIKPVLPIGQKFAVITKARIMLSNISDNTLNLNEYDFVGGFTPDLINSTEYYGSDAKQYGLANYFYYRLGGQYEIIRNLFFQAHFNYLSTEYPIKWIYSDADIGKLGNRTSRYGFAGSLGFKSPLGPVSVALAKDVYDKGMQASLMIGFVY
jgi:hypothetical protein